jgi:hypothetical protein
VSARTFEQLPTVHLTRGELKSDHMTLRRICQSSPWLVEGSCVLQRTCASLSSLMGMPIVEVSLPMLGGCADRGAQAVSIRRIRSAGDDTESDRGSRRRYGAS